MYFQRIKTFVLKLLKTGNFFSMLSHNFFSFLSFQFFNTINFYAIKRFRKKKKNWYFKPIDKKKKRNSFFTEFSFFSKVAKYQELPLFKELLQKLFNYYFMDIFVSLEKQVNELLLINSTLLFLKFHPH